MKVLWVMCGLSGWLLSFLSPKWPKEKLNMDMVKWLAESENMLGLSDHILLVLLPDLSVVMP